MVAPVAEEELTLDLVVLEIHLRRLFLKEMMVEMPRHRITQIPEAVEEVVAVLLP